MPISNPGSVPASSLLVPVNTEVFNAAATVGWVDLDLSATIGAKPTWCLLGIGFSISEQVAVRANGDALEYYNVDANASRGCALVEGLTTGIFVVATALTDPAGILEVKASKTDNLIIRLLAYEN